MRFTQKSCGGCGAVIRLPAEKCSRCQSDLRIVGTYHSRSVFAGIIDAWRCAPAHVGLACCPRCGYYSKGFTGKHCSECGLDWSRRPPLSPGRWWGPSALAVWISWTVVAWGLGFVAIGEAADRLWLPYRVGIVYQSELKPSSEYVPAVFISATASESVGWLGGTSHNADTVWIALGEYTGPNSTLDYPATAALWIELQENKCSIPVTGQDIGPASVQTIVAWCISRGLNTTHPAHLAEIQELASMIVTWDGQGEMRHSDSYVKLPANHLAIEYGPAVDTSTYIEVAAVLALVWALGLVAIHAAWRRLQALYRPTENMRAPMMTNALIYSCSGPSLLVIALLGAMVRPKETWLLRVYSYWDIYYDVIGLLSIALCGYGIVMLLRHRSNGVVAILLCTGMAFNMMLLCGYIWIGPGILLMNGR